MTVSGVTVVTGAATGNSLVTPLSSIAARSIRFRMKRRRTFMFCALYGDDLFRTVSSFDSCVKNLQRGQQAFRANDRDCHDLCSLHYRSNVLKKCTARASPGRGSSLTLGEYISVTTYSDKSHFGRRTYRITDENIAVVHRDAVRGEAEVTVRFADLDPNSRSTLFAVQCSLRALDRFRFISDLFGDC